MTGFAETGHSWLANTGPTMTADGPIADWQVSDGLNGIADIPSLGSLTRQDPQLAIQTAPLARRFRAQVNVRAGWLSIHRTGRQYFRRSG
jgi:hypothetical protein